MYANSRLPWDRVSGASDSVRLLASGPVRHAQHEPDPEKLARRAVADVHGHADDCAVAVPAGCPGLGPADGFLPVRKDAPAVRYDNVTLRRGNLPAGVVAVLAGQTVGGGNRPLLPLRSAHAVRRRDRVPYRLSFCPRLIFLIINLCRKDSSRHNGRGEEANVE